MGKRQVGELEVGELVSTLLISEIVSIPIDTPEVPLLNAVIPMSFILATEIIISYVKNKSRKLKNVIEGTPSFVIYNGHLDQGVLTDNRISINEVLSEMRTQAIPDIKDVRFCVLEAGGKLSFFKADDDISLPLIIDGEKEIENIKKLGVNDEWLQKNLKNKRVKDVFLFTANTALDTNIIYKEEKNENKK